MRHEDRRQAEPTKVLAHHIGGGAGMGEEAGVEIGQIRVHRAAHDHAGPTVEDPRSGHVERGLFDIDGGIRRGS